ncbi:MAG: hypothetical protein M0C28_15860 [Candidatus Moduliflexus flocculans]|nr:hypothetical protein [Candidatus Moduliflexus flocculans]
MFNWKKNVLFAVIFSALFAFNNIANAYTPQSLYDDVWKLIKNKYVDVNENGQRWERWRHKYDKVIKTEQDAYVAIETMIASLNDPYTKFLDPEEFAEEGQSIKGTLPGYRNSNWRKG